MRTASDILYDYFRSRFQVTHPLAISAALFAHLTFSQDVAGIISNPLQFSSLSSFHCSENIQLRKHYLLSLSHGALGMDTGGKRKMKADYPLDLIGRLRKREHQNEKAKWVKVGLVIASRKI